MYIGITGTMSVTISTVNVGVIANDGSGDDIRDAFIKVNYSLSNLKTGIDTVSTGGANTTLAKVANLQVTNQVFGNLYLTGSDTVYINGSPVTTAGNAFTGGNVAGAAAFQNATGSNGSAYGAVTITGGLGVGQNIYVAGIGVYTGNLVVASVTDASSTTAAALISRGGLGVAKSAYIGQNFNVAGTTALSSTLGVTGVTSITNSTASTNSSTGALLVSGGVGAAGNINAGGTQHTLSGNLTVTGNLAVNGNLTFGTDTLRISDNIIDLHTDSANSPLTIDDGKDVGIRFHVYKSGYGDYAAFAGWANDSTMFEYYDRGVEIGSVFTGNTYGTFKGGGFLSVNTTAATSTTTGAIITSGGIAAAGNIYAGGNLVVTANVSAGNLTIISNISAGNISATKGTFTSVAGTLLTAAQTNITSVGTLSAVTVSGTATLGNVITTNGLFWSNGVAFSASSTYSNTNVAAYLTGTVTVGNLITTNGVFWSNGATALGGAGGGYGNTQVAQYLPVYSGSLGGTLTTAAQTNITSVGTLTSLAVGAVTSSGTVIASTVNAGTIGNTGATHVGTSATLTGTLIATTVNAGTIGNSGATLTGTISTAAQTNITSIGTLTSLAVGAVTSSGTIIASTVNAGTIGNSGATLTGTISTAAQTNITSVGTLSSLTVSGTTNSGTLTAATLNATSANITTLAATTGLSTANAVITGGSINNVTVGATTHTTGRFTTVTATTVNAGTIGNASANIVGTIGTAAQTNITSVGTLTGLTVSGAIIPNANVSIDLGSSSAWFNNIYGVSIQAKYADLAEHYVTDTHYKPGTVVVFGGSAEITLATEFADVSVAGVISTDPAYLMNAANPGQPVALRGRVPIDVIGPVQKGDLLVTSDCPGYAVSVGKNANYGVAVFAKALQDKDDDGVGTIEAVII
jgi:hypothetical protein